MTQNSKDFMVRTGTAELSDGRKVFSVGFCGGEDALKVITNAMSVLEKEPSCLGPIIEGRAYLISDDIFLADRIRAVLSGSAPVGQQNTYLHFITNSLQKLELSVSRLQAAVDKLSAERDQ